MQSLSNRELEVYEMIGQGLTIQQIAGRLHLSPKTVETHREKIKQKLNLKSSTELNRRAVQWVLERGWSSATSGDQAVRRACRGACNALSLTGPLRPRRPSSTALPA